MTEPFAPDTETHIADALALVAQMSETVADLDTRLDAEIAASKDAHPAQLAAYMTDAERAQLAPVVPITSARGGRLR